MNSNQQPFESSVYRTIFNESHNGVCIITAKGEYLDVNQSFAEMLGYENKNDLIGMYFRDVTHPEDMEIDRELTRKIFSGEISHFELDKRFVTKEKEIIWLKLRASLYEGIYGIGVLEPVDERSRLESKIAELKKDLAQFVYRTSHDLRSPITNMIGLADLEDVKEEDYKRFMGMVRENAMKLDHIIREITDYSTNHRFRVKKEEVNLSWTINEVCESVLADRKSDKKINLKTDIKYLNGVSVDRSRLSIVLKNLIANALNFSDDDGNIEIMADVNDSNLIIKVKDDGAGIRKDIQAKIYDMFYRGSNISEGAGLGLFIVKDVLKEISGEISFKSKEGEGSEFEINIPV